MLNRPAHQRLHLTGIDELPADFDEEIADLFREMREATGLSLDDLAAQLGTPPATLSALERGDMRGLPAWPETNRVVLAYTERLSLDPDPVLRRIMLQLPPDHPRRPRTAEAAPSYANLRSNVDAALSRVPNEETPVERQSLPTSSAPAHVAPAAARPAPPRTTTAMPQPPASGNRPGYDDLRAIPNDPRWPPYPPQPHASMPQARRRNGLGTTLLQLLLLLAILASGYAMWLAINDPLAFTALKSQLESGLQPIVEWSRGLASSAPQPSQ